MTQGEGPPEIRLGTDDRFDTCCVSDAMDRLGLRGVPEGIRRLTGGAAVGPAVTVTLRPRAVSASDRHLAVEAIAEAPPGAVVVVAAEGFGHAAAWGGLLSIAASRHDVAGTVVDGLCRDVDEISDLAYPVFGRGTSPVSARGRLVEESWNKPVTVSEIPVQPGDLVVADGSGVVFVPREKVPEVLAMASEIARIEARLASALRSGDPPASVLDRGYETLLLRSDRG